MKPRILFLDDRTRRFESARRQYAERYEVTIVTNVRECLRYLSREDFYEVHLDHDLRGCDFEDPDSPETGMEVVRYIEKTGWPPEKRKPLFIVHSSNLFAASLMVRRLKNIGLDAIFRPFQYDDAVPNIQYDEKGIPIP
jgi:hypothetical protein